VKQAELNKLTNASMKKVARRHRWRSISGQAFWREGNLFFVLGCFGLARQRSLHSTLRFKWFSLDDQLWNILGLSSNAAGPMSLRANGAFTITGQSVFEDKTEDSEWSPEWVEAKLEDVAAVAAAKATEVASVIRNIDDYLVFIERGHAALIARYPNAVVTIWVERLLAALDKNDRATAARIATARIEAGDVGSFMVDGQTFYQRAREYVGRDA